MESLRALPLAVIVIPDLLLLIIFYDIKMIQGRNH